MNDLPPMHLIAEVSGYVASGLVLLAFAVTSMRLLRTIAILSNIAFIAYGALNGLAPVLALHLSLLPLNIFRLKHMGAVPSERENALPQKVDAIAPCRVACRPMLRRNQEPAL